MSKSYVGMAAERCAICGNNHTETILMDRRLRATFEDGKTYTSGSAPCPECKSKLEAGYVALVEIDPEKSAATDKDATIMQKEAYRTGNISWIRSKVWADVFNVPIPDPPLCFVGAEVTDKLRAMQPTEAGKDE